MIPNPPYRFGMQYDFSRLNENSMKINDFCCINHKHCEKKFSDVDMIKVELESSNAQLQNFKKLYEYAQDSLQNVREHNPELYFSLIKFFLNNDLIDQIYRISND